VRRQRKEPVTATSERHVIRSSSLCCVYKFEAYSEWNLDAILLTFAACEKSIPSARLGITVAPTSANGDPANPLEVGAAK
jgi:hypothetical protein